MCVVFLSGYEFFAIVVSCWGRCSDILYFVTIFLQIVAVDEWLAPDIVCVFCRQVQVEHNGLIFGMILVNVILLSYTLFHLFVVSLRQIIED